MKFTAKEDFRVERQLFEAGNTYNSDNYALTEARVMSFYSAGWVEIEGKEPAPARVPGAKTIVIEDTAHA
jgi:hypothetical protein